MRSERLAAKAREREREAQKNSNKKGKKGEAPGGQDCDETGGEEERLQRSVEALSLFAQRCDVTWQRVSEFAKQRESFGIVWLNNLIITRMGVPVHPLHRLDLSGTRGIPYKSLHLLLAGLPVSVEELKIDSRVVKGAALPGFVQFLEGLKSRREEGQETPSLKSIDFAGNTLGPSEAKEVFPPLLQLPGLETLCLKGNPLGREGLRVLGEAVPYFPTDVESLRTLNLDDTVIPDEEGTRPVSGESKPNEGKGAKKERHAFDLLCRASFNKRLRLETLDLSNNYLTGFIFLFLDSFVPHLRVLVLRECTAGALEFSLLGRLLEKGALPCLEMVDLEGHKWEGRDRMRGWGLERLSRGLKVMKVPKLKHLNLMEELGYDSEESTETFLNALADLECAPLEHVRLHLAKMSTEKARGLGEGKFAALRSLRLHLRQPETAAFLQGMQRSIETAGGGEGEGEAGREVNGGEGETEEGAERRNERGLSVGEVGRGKESRFEWLYLHLHKPREGKLRLLGDGLRLGLFESLRELHIDGEQGENDLISPEGNHAFLTGLSASKLSSLSHLTLCDMEFTDAEMVLLRGVVGAGCLARLEVLDLKRSGNFGRVGMEALMSAVVESEQGLPFLEKLLLAHSYAGEGVGSLGVALTSGKLPKVSSLDLENSELTDEAVRGLAEAVRQGAGGGLVHVDMSENREVSSEAWDDFVRAIAESEGGLRSLVSFRLRNNQAMTEEGGGLLMRAFASRKLSSLSGSASCIGDWEIDERGVEALGDLIRRGGFEVCAPSFAPCWLPWKLEEWVRDEDRICVDQLMHAILESDKGLDGISFSRCVKGGRIGREGMEGLVECFRQRKLQSDNRLELSDCGLTDETLSVLGEHVRQKSFVFLAGLDLSRNKNVGGEGVENLMGAITECDQGLPFLETLKLGAKGGEGGASVANALELEKLPSLVELQMGSLASEGVSALAEIVRKGKFPQTVRKVHLTNNSESENIDEFIRAVEVSEKGLPNLNTLEGGRLQAVGLRSLAACFMKEKLPKLSILSLCGCGVDDEGLKMLGFGFCLNFSPALTHLKLRRNNITADGVTAFVDCLRPESLPNLVSLSLQKQQGSRATAEKKAFREAVGVLLARANSEGKLEDTKIIC